jgi:hypothetical protein
VVFRILPPGLRAKAGLRARAGTGRYAIRRSCWSTQPERKRIGELDAFVRISEIQIS